MSDLEILKEVFDRSYVGYSVKEDNISWSSDSITWEEGKQISMSMWDTDYCGAWFYFDMDGTLKSFYAAQ